MRLYERNQMIAIVDTVQEMFHHIRTLREHDCDNNYLKQCKETLELLHHHMKKLQSDGIKNSERIMMKLIAECQFLIEKKDGEQKKTLKKLERMAEHAKQSLREHVPVRKQVVFLPYKASMWTALESIWKAAEADPDCDAIVIPIPFYELDNHGHSVRTCYEREMFPAYVPITDYRDYSFAQNQPELIFIHNPYDEYNRVTRVFEQFYSSHLKAFTECLVYSPYFTYSWYTKGVSDKWFMLPAVINSHKVIVQSEKVQQTFSENYGFDAKKFLPIGSPKMDAVIKKTNMKIPMPSEWKAKLVGKEKIFLLNTHMAYFLSLTNYAKKIPSGINYGIQYHREILKTFLEDHPECGLIWRPHPLMKAVMNKNYAEDSDFEESLEFIDEMEEALLRSENCVIDRSGDYSIAFAHSDALISTYSSLIQEYMATGKPVLVFQTKQSEDAARQAFVNLRCNYFRFLPDNVSFCDFVEMVINGKDPKKEERMRVIRSAFANLDGTAGEKAYWELSWEIQK